MSYDAKQELWRGEVINLCFHVNWEVKFLRLTVMRI